MTSPADSNDPVSEPETKRCDECGHVVVLNPDGTFPPHERGGRMACVNGWPESPRIR